MTSTSHDISTLNRLIVSALDSVHGYIAAADDARSGRLGGLFRARAYERGVVALSFQVQVERLGGTPADGGALAGAPRAFPNFKGAVTGGVHAIVDAVERGEDEVRARFETALQDDRLSAPVKATIETGFTSVNEGHGQMRDLRHSLETAG